MNVGYFLNTQLSRMWNLSVNCDIFLIIYSIREKETAKVFCDNVSCDGLIYCKLFTLISQVKSSQVNYSTFNICIRDSLYVHTLFTLAHNCT